MSIITKRTPAVMPVNIGGTFVVCLALFRELHATGSSIHNHILGEGRLLIYEETEAHRDDMVGLGKTPSLASELDTPLLHMAWCPQGYS